MKKCFNFKILLSILLVCAMFLPTVSAFYSSMALAVNDSPSTMRYPMFNGSNIHISSGRRERYSNYYKRFFSECPQQRPEESYYLLARTPERIYEQELKHVGACAYATALFLDCNDAEALRFAANMIKLCNLITGYPKDFNKTLLIFVVNYIYALLGNLFKQGSRYDIINAERLFRFSDSAYHSSATYCGTEEKPCGKVISQEMISACMTAPQ